MNKNYAAATEQNKKLDDYLKEENYEKADEISRELCRMQGLEPVDEMPSDFLLQLKRKEKKEMKNVKKISKNFTRVAAVVVCFLLVGGIASAAEKIYHTTIVTFRNDISTENSVTITTNDGQGLFPGETTTKVIEQEYADSDQTWLEKKVIDETSTAYKSDNNEDWIPYEITDRVTEYKYEKYSDAVKDAQFANVFTKDYSGTVYYRERQHILEEADVYPDNKDCSISADLISGSSTFTVEQLKLLKYDESVEVDSTTCLVTPATGDDVISTERAYKASSGYEYMLIDDNESGKTRTTVTVSGDEYNLVLRFSEMDETDIYNILENIDIRALVDF